MANQKTPRSAWIHAGLRTLQASGVAGVRIEDLARSLGVTKGGFYGHFPNRRAFLEELLADWEEEVTSRITDLVEAGPADPRERLRHLSRLVLDRERPGREIETELAVREWARRDAQVADVVRRVDAIQAGFLHGLFARFCSDEEARARTIIAMSTRLAEHFLSFDDLLGHPVSATDSLLERLLR